MGYSLIVNGFIKELIWYSAKPIATYYKISFVNY